MNSSIEDVLRCTTALQTAVFEVVDSNIGERQSLIALKACEQRLLAALKKFRKDMEP